MENSPGSSNSPVSNCEMFTNSSEKMTCLQHCVLLTFQICGTFPPVFMKVEGNPVQMRCQCFYSAVVANTPNFGHLFKITILKGRSRQNLLTMRFSSFLP